MKTSGIYKIVNKVNGKYYVGSSASVIDRWIEHKRMLRKNIHDNEHLQRAWNKYREDSFSFMIAESCQLDKEVLLSTEQVYLDIARSEKDKTYNKSFVAGRVDMTEETRRKIGIANAGKNNGNYTRVFSSEERLRMSISHRGEKHHMWGKHHSDESKRKNSESNKKAQSGKNNARYDPTIYTFHNPKLGETFSGSKYEFYTKYKLPESNVRGLIRGRQKSVKKWRLVTCRS